MAGLYLSNKGRCNSYRKWKGGTYDRGAQCKVDGYSPKPQEVFEYLGCYWHGCPCISNRHNSIGKTGETLLSRYEETTARINKIENAGYKVVSVWGASLENCLVKI